MGIAESEILLACLLFVSVAAYCLQAIGRIAVPARGQLRADLVPASPATLATGDVLLVVPRGHMGWRSSMQKFLTNSEFTHMALVVRYNDVPFVLHSTPETNVTVEPLTPHDPDTWVTRRLAPPLTRDQTRALKRFAAAAVRRQYSFGLWLAGYARLFPWLPLPRVVTAAASHSGRHTFCSQLVAEAYDAAGVFDLAAHGMCAEELMPRDFAEESECLLPWAEGHALRIERALEWPNKDADR